jgi:hypothetical protein
MKSDRRFYILALRIASSAWVLMTLVTAPFSIAFAAVMGLVAFPIVALIWGLICSGLQWRALARLSQTEKLLSVGHDKSINIQLPAAQTLRIVESAVKATCVINGAQHSWQSVEPGFSVRVAEVADSAKLLAPWYQTRVTVMVTEPSASQSTVQINCDPVHFWIFGFFFVDLGRSARHLKYIESAIQARVSAQQKVVDERRQQESEQAKASEATLAMLRAQVEPHFIFNTLAHVKASVDAQSTDAHALLDALVDFLRSNTHALASTTLTLGEEMQLVERYLKLIELRLGKKLQTSVHCSESLHQHIVPTASVLVLAENAVKHGIEQSAEGGMIDVQCVVSYDRLNISVQNTGPKFAMNSGRKGGLSNLQERLKIMYGDASEIEIENVESGVKVQFYIPIAVQPTAVKLLE